MNRKKIIDEIIELMSRFRTEVETCASVNLYDINIHGENVIIPILNKIYELKLVNANYEDKNTSAIDLIDREVILTFYTCRYFVGDTLYCPCGTGK
jgi:hypothetical protein